MRMGVGFLLPMVRCGLHSSPLPIGRLTAMETGLGSTTMVGLGSTMHSGGGLLTTTDAGSGIPATAGAGGRERVAFIVGAPLSSASSATAAAGRTSVVSD